MPVTKAGHALERGSGTMHSLCHVSVIRRSHLLLLAFSWGDSGRRSLLWPLRLRVRASVTEGVHFLGVVHCLAQTGLLSLAFQRTPLLRLAQASACFRLLSLALRSRHGGLLQCRIG